MSNETIEQTNKNLNQKNNDLVLEIKRRKIVEKKLATSATHDNLTGLPNRLLLEDRLSQVLLISKRKNTVFGVLFFDLDKFKPINDTFGHEVGDKLLQAVGERLKP